MNAEEEKKLDLFLKNNDLLIHKYWYENASLVSLAALMCTAENREADLEHIEHCRHLLKDRVGVFSNLRGNMIRPLSVKMALSEDPQAYLEGLLSAYQKLESGKLLRSVFEVPAAMVLYESRDSVDIDTAAARVHEIYRKMRSNHPLLTGREDMASATLFAVSGKEEDALLDEMEECYRLLKPGFTMNGNEIQTICAMLAADDRPAGEKTAKVRELHTCLKERGYHLRLSNSMALLGALSLADKPAAEIADAVAEIAGRLKGHRGFGPFTQGKYGRLTCAMMLYMDMYVSSVKNTAVQSALNTIILVQIIVTVILICSVTAGNAASSSSN